MKEQYSSIYDSERYIYGKYNEVTNNLVYLKMSTELKLSPLLYCFPDLKYPGCWTAFSPIFGGFFTFGQAEGYAEVTIKEDTVMSPNEILTKYNKVVDDGWELNMTLIENGVDDYMGDIF